MMAGLGGSGVEPPASMLLDRWATREKGDRPLEALRRAPARGPTILFFTGGTALRSLSRKIVDYTYNTVHIINPFDSGGSSAKLRQAFAMPAVGDIRNRIMALADRNKPANLPLYRLFSHRLPAGESQGILSRRLKSLVEGKDELILAVPEPMRGIVLGKLAAFFDRMPGHFDLRGACVGNLILTGGYLTYHRQMDPVIYVFSRLVDARGEVDILTNRSLHLASELRDGTVLVGQHLITGKEAPPISSPVRRIYLAEDMRDPQPVELLLRQRIRLRILEANLVCYPVGSFYSSLVASFLARGIGDAIAQADCPKVYVPNLGHDPEQKGMTLADCVATLSSYLQKSCFRKTPTSKLLDTVIVDSKNGFYGGPVQFKEIEGLGVEILDTELVTEESRPFIDAGRLAECLLSLA